MSSVGLIIEERSRDIGDFLVGRLIPFRKKRMIGPFIFIDHMGPTTLGPNKYLDVDQHPHIGLATLTYLIEGEIMHRDSIGTEQRITPGSVNLMVAGSGVSHTERTPQDLRNGRTFATHGYQIWIALPMIHEEILPEFHHIQESRLPQWEDGNANFKLIAGKGFDRVSPVPVFSNLFMVEVKTTGGYQLNVLGKLFGEIGICIVEGSILACDRKIEKGNILVSKVDDSCNIGISPNTHLLLFGGEPLEEERHIYWNFVSHSKERIETAKKQWREKDFPMMSDDKSYISLPGQK